MAGFVSLCTGLHTSPVFPLQAFYNRLQLLLALYPPPPIPMAWSQRPLVLSAHPWPLSLLPTMWTFPGPASQAANTGQFSCLDTWLHLLRLLFLLPKPHTLRPQLHTRSCRCPLHSLCSTAIAHCNHSTCHLSLAAWEPPSPTAQPRQLTTHPLNSSAVIIVVAVDKLKSYQFWWATWEFVKQELDLKKINGEGGLSHVRNRKYHHAGS